MAKMHMEKGGDRNHENGMTHNRRIKCVKEYANNDG